LLLLGASPSRADPKLFVVLDYRLDQTLGGCPNEATFTAMVEGQLGYDPFRSPAPLKVVASAGSRAEGLRGTIEWYDASGSRRGERQLSSEHTDCVAFARAMSFAVAVQIQLLAREAEGSASAPPAPTAAEASPPRSDAGTKPSQARPAARDVLEPAPHAHSDERAPWRFSIGAGPFVAFGMAPRAAPGGRLFAAGRVDWFALEFGAEATLPANYSLAGTAGFDEHVAFGSIAGCAITGRWSFCSVSKLGRYYVRGFGVDLPRDVSGGVMLTGARLMLGQELSGRWLGTLRLESLATLGTWDVTLNQRTVWTTPVVSLSLGVELGLLFL
jgi:hypothetical protein